MQMIEVDMVAIDKAGGTVDSHDSHWRCTFLPGQEQIRNPKRLERRTTENPVEPVSAGATCKGCSGSFAAFLFSISQ